MVFYYQPKVGHNVAAFAWEHGNATSGIEQRISWAFGDEATADSYGSAGYIGMGKADAWQIDSTRDSYLAFATSENAAVRSVRINNSGNVGIGETWKTPCENGR